MKITPGNSYNKSTWGRFKANSTGTLTVTTKSGTKVEGSARVRETVVEYTIPALEASDLPAVAEIKVNGKTWKTVSLEADSAPAASTGGSGGGSSIIYDFNQTIIAMGKGPGGTELMGPMIVEGEAVTPIEVDNPRPGEGKFTVTSDGLYEVQLIGGVENHSADTVNNRYSIFFNTNNYSVTAMVPPHKAVDTASEVQHARVIPLKAGTVLDIGFFGTLSADDLVEAGIMIIKLTA